MSMYNMIHGINPVAKELLMLAGIKGELVIEGPFRFRDCYGNEDGTEIVLYTRIGGPNRAKYADPIEMLQQAPTYLRDVDDEFDETFASFYFKPATDLAAALLKKMHDKGMDGSERPGRARQLLDDLENHRETDLTRDMLEKMKPMGEAMRRSLDPDAPDSIVVETMNGGSVSLARAGAKVVGEETPTRDE